MLTWGRDLGADEGGGGLVMLKAQRLAGIFATALLDGDLSVGQHPRDGALNVDVRRDLYRCDQGVSSVSARDPISDAASVFN